MQNQTEFESVIDRWVSARLASPMTWNSLVCSLPGVYPEVVLNSAKRLSLLDRIYFPPIESSGPLTSAFALDLWAEEKILTPHALDSAWWFGDPALETLLERIENFTRRATRCCCLELLPCCITPGNGAGIGYSASWIVSQPGSKRNSRRA